MKINISTYTYDKELIDTFTTNCCQNSLKPFVRNVAPAKNIISLSKDKAVIDTGKCIKEITVVGYIFK